MNDDAARLEDLRAAARYTRQRRDLYRAKVYGPRFTTAEKLRELERDCDSAQQRLAFAESEIRRAAAAQNESNEEPSHG